MNQYDPNKRLEREITELDQSKCWIDYARSSLCCCDTVERVKNDPAHVVAPPGGRRSPGRVRRERVVRAEVGGRGGRRLSVLAVGRLVLQPEQRRVLREQPRGVVASQPPHRLHQPPHGGAGVGARPRVQQRVRPAVGVVGGGDARQVGVAAQRHTEQTPVVAERVGRVEQRGERPPDVQPDGGRVQLPARRQRHRDVVAPEARRVGERLQLVAAERPPGERRLQHVGARVAARPAAVLAQVGAAQHVALDGEPGQRVRHHVVDRRAQVVEEVVERHLLGARPATPQLHRLAVRRQRHQALHRAAAELRAAAPLVQVAVLGAGADRLAPQLALHAAEDVPKQADARPALRRAPLRHPPPAVHRHPAAAPPPVPQARQRLDEVEARELVLHLPVGVLAAHAHVERRQQPQQLLGVRLSAAQTHQLDVVHREAAGRPTLL